MTMLLKVDCIPPPGTGQH